MERQIDIFLHKTCEKDQETETKSWADLQQDILSYIFSKLHYVDQIRFRAVCKPWRLSEDRMARCSDNLPWVMHHAWMGSIISHRSPFESELFDPHLKNIYKVSNSVEKIKSLSRPFNATTVCASKQGWLLIGFTGQGCSFFIHNPFSNQVILLPHLEYWYRAATFSASPSSEDCELFVLFGRSAYSRRLYVASYRLYTSKKWRVRYIGTVEKEFHAVQYIKGKLYCLFEEGMLRCYNLADKSWELLSPSLPHNISCFMDRCWLIENEGDLIMAWSPSFDHDEWCALKFDWSEKKWSDLDIKLENRGFFISGEVSFSAPLTGNNGGKIKDCRVFYLSEEVYLAGTRRFICYSLKRKRRIEPQDYGWIKRPYWMMSFMEPPYVRN